MDLNKHIATNNTSKPFHSSGLAEAAFGDHLGAISNTSFEQRRQIDRNRQAIQNYQRSAVGNAYRALRTRPTPVARNIVIGRSTPHTASAPINRYNPFP